MALNAIINNRQLNKSTPRSRRSQPAAQSPTILFKPMSISLLTIFLVLSSLSPPPVKSQLDEQECMDHCHEHATESRFPFTFDCYEVYDDTRDQVNCKNVCSKCPYWICDSWHPNEFNCPGVRLTDVCQRRCDASRKPEDYFLSYTLTCDQAFTSTWDIFACQSDCDQCPGFVCNPNVDNNVFHCPPNDHDLICERDCDYVRSTVYAPGYRAAFQFTCLEQGPDWERCQENCGVCSETICNPYVDKNTYHCPALPPSPPISPGRPPPPTGREPEREYEGRCKDRCDRARLGRDIAFELKCIEAYSTPAEQNHCIEDCMHCPDEICDGRARFAGASTLHCPDQNGYKMEDKTSDTKKSKDTMDSSSSSPIHLSPLAIAGIVIVVLLLIAGGIGTAVYCLKKKKADGTGGAQGPVYYSQPQVSQTPSMMQNASSPSGGIQGYSPAPSYTQHPVGQGTPGAAGQGQGQFNYPVTIYS